MPIILGRKGGGGGGGGSPTGPAGGDLAGTYPNPTIAAGAVDNTALGDVGAWTAFAPTLTAATTNPSGLAEQSGLYAVVGGVVIVQAHFEYGGSPTVGSGELRSTLPPVVPAAEMEGRWLGSGFWFDSSGNKIPLFPRMKTAPIEDYVVIWRDGAGTTAQNANAYAANDQFTLNYIYRAA